MLTQLLPLPIKPLTTDMIRNFMNHYSSHFQGVYASNNIPHHLCHKKEFAIICNLSPDYSKGTHWVAIYCKADKMIYMDSYGLPPLLNPDIWNFIENCHRPLIFSKSRLQSDNSDACGYYCILIILYHEKASKLFKLNFDENLANNDVKCISYIKKILYE